MVALQELILLKAVDCLLHLLCSLHSRMGMNQVSKQGYIPILFKWVTSATSTLGEKTLELRGKSIL